MNNLAAHRPTRNNKNLLERDYTQRVSALKRARSFDAARQKTRPRDIKITQRTKSFAPAAQQTIACYTVDTNAVIYYLQNDAAAVAFFLRAAARRTPVYISGVSETELLSYPPSLQATFELLRTFWHFVSSYTPIHASLVSPENCGVCTE